MRAISLWQPWASAIAVGLKTIETRGWPTDYRGPLAIHAARRWTPMQRDFTASCHGIPKSVPLGSIVCVARLVDCCRVETLTPNDSDRFYGDFSAGRFGWLLADVRMLAEPVPFAGKQGFFSVPDELLVSGVRADVLPGQQKLF